jgi:hypothetical protein
MHNPKKLKISNQKKKARTPTCQTGNQQQAKRSLLLKHG